MRYGVKAALTDAWVMAEMDVDLLEVHIGLEDLPRRGESMLNTFRSIRSDGGQDLIVHAPEFMMVTGMATLVDPSSRDESLREMSNQMLQAAIRFAGDVDAKMVIVHPGGIYPNTDDPRAQGGIDRLAGSLGELGDLAGDVDVAITLENMPWFYNRKPLDGGQTQQWESTILVKPDDTGPLLGLVDGMTLDVSHGYLHTPQGGMEVIHGFIKDHGDLIRHLHLSDALPPDHEGLQIGEGNVDFMAILTAFKDRNVTAVPEIMGGHMGGGISFRRALEELRQLEASL
jgi:sugar phosphate isomerase/epimerase